MKNLSTGERVARFISLVFVVSFMCYMFVKFIFF